MQKSTSEFWHGDYRRDILGRSVEQIEREIARHERIIRIRELYRASAEGYTARTAALRRDLEIDKEHLEKLRKVIRAHENRGIDRR